MRLHVYDIEGEILRALSSKPIVGSRQVPLEEHRSSTVGKHFREHNDKSVDFVDCFDILKKCRSKFDCLVYEMLFIRKTKPSLINKQSDFVRAKVFV